MALSQSFVEPERSPSLPRPERGPHERDLADAYRRIEELFRVSQENQAAIIAALVDLDARITAVDARVDALDVRVTALENP